jgi:hypothetical protein
VVRWWIARLGWGNLLTPGFDRLGDDDRRRGRPRKQLAEAAGWGREIETG